MDPKQKSILNFAIFFVAAILIAGIAYLRSQDINHYVYGVAEGSGFSKAYLGMFYKINKDTRINGQTPIQYAILSEGKLTEKKKQNLEKAIDYFTQKGVDINENSEYGLTAIHYAIMSEDPVAIALLIEKKADVNKPIHFEGDEEIAKNNKTEGMSPLKYILDRQKQKKIKNPANVDIIINQLKSAGAK